MPAILYPEWKIVKKFNTIGYSGGTGVTMKSLSKRLLVTLVSTIALAIPMGAIAGIIFVPIGEFIPTNLGENRIKSNDGGEFVLTSRGVGGSFYVICDRSRDCVDADLDGSQFVLNQDLRIVIDFTSAGIITGATRGTLNLPLAGITLPDSVKFKGTVKGSVECQADTERACAVATLNLRIPVALTDSADGSAFGLMELYLAGTIYPGSGSAAWESLISPQATLAIFDDE
jgi:hypothetical protein